MNGLLRSVRRLTFVAAVAAALVAARTAAASSPAQTSTGGSAVFDNLIFIVIGGVMMALLASVAGGVVIAVLASGVSRFFRRNLPTDEEMAELRAEIVATDERKPRKPIKIGPAAEPFVYSAIGFIVFFIIFSFALSLTPPPVRGEAAESAAEEAPAAAAALPKEGDLGSITDGLPKGDPENGARLFVSSGCSGCHSQKKDERLVGPSFYNLWDVAATRVPGLTAKEYLYQSIVDPNAYVVEGYQAGLMQQNYAALLSPQQMADILAWIEQRHSNEP